MRRRVSLAAVALAIIALASTCTGGGPNPTPNLSASPLRGGILRVGWSYFGDSWDTGLQSFDPIRWELSRCCLLRTLLSYNGQSTEKGGTTLRPDLASSLPAISADGRTWTFHLKRGIHYAPPLQNVGITAGDFIRAFERTAMGAPSADATTEPLFQVGGPEGLRLNESLQGWQAYADGNASSISGLEAPDPYTLRIHLTRPTGDLGYRLTYPALAPIPPNPGHPEETLGVAAGHDGDYGFFLVASGPYMFAGAGDVDYSLPAVRQAPAPGIRNDSITLVRNPSWDPATDDLRKAYPNRIIIRGFDLEHASKGVETGSVDVLADFNPSPLPVIRRYTTDPALRRRIFFTPKDYFVSLFMNVAVPPLDDVRVRRAVAFAIDRRATLDAFKHKRGEPATVGTHLLPDSMEDNLLLNYAPFGTGGSRKAARAEMAKSSYDHNDDGVCDGRACNGIVFLVRESAPERVAMANIIQRNLRPLGIGVRLRVVDDDTFFALFHDPAQHIAFQLLEGGKDYPSGGDFLPVTFGSDTLCPDVCGNLSNIGATPNYLRKYGYAVRHVPNLDSRIHACEPLAFGPAVRCWAELDQYITEQVVPMVPLLQELFPTLVSKRVAQVSFDQAGENLPIPSFDRIDLVPLAQSQSSPLPSPSPIPARFPQIPNGRYKEAVTMNDLIAAGLDPNDIGALQENAGRMQITIQDGRWRSVQRSNVHVFNPVASGVYYGTGDEVAWVTQLPQQNAGVVHLRWSSKGNALHFDVLGAASKDPGAIALFEVHPWVKVR
jgi:peptide/nickel transport system substrate-binding protein